LLATGFQNYAKAKLGFDGASQKPTRWNNVKERNNKGSDESYKRWGFRDVQMKPTSIRVLEMKERHRRII